jgi:hypothetical protein
MASSGKNLRRKTAFEREVIYDQIPVGHFGINAVAVDLHFWATPYLCPTSHSHATGF